MIKIVFSQSKWPINCFIQVTEGVHVAIGYALANSILIEAPEGLIVVDTTESEGAMQEVWKEFRKISDKPLKGVIYSHSHEDHVGGTAVSLLQDLLLLIQLINLIHTRNVVPASRASQSTQIVVCYLYCSLKACGCLKMALMCHWLKGQ